MAETHFSQTFFNVYELCIGADGYDCVYVEGWPNRRSRGIGQEELGHTSSDECDLVEKRSQSGRDREKMLEIGIRTESVHLESILAESSRIAISRSRARPSRMASTRASSS